MRSPNAFRFRGRDWDLASACRQSPSGAGAPVAWNRRVLPSFPRVSARKTHPTGGHRIFSDYQWWFYGILWWFNGDLMGFYVDFMVIMNDVSFYMLAPRRASPAFSSWGTCSCEMEEQWDHLKIILHQRSKFDVLSQTWHQERTTTEPGGAGAFHRAARAAGASMRLVKLFFTQHCKFEQDLNLSKTKVGGECWISSILSTSRRWIWSV